MISDIRRGDRVRLLSLPDWLTHDLPVREQKEVKRCVGQVAVVADVDDYGYFWLDFGEMIEGASSAHYSGHSFCVPREHIELITTESE